MTDEEIIATLRRFGVRFPPASYAGLLPPLRAILSAQRETEIARLRADAARYRWLRRRDLETVYDGGVFVGVTPDNLVINGDDLDRHIDEAMRSEGMLAELDPDRLREDRD